MQPDADAHAKLRAVFDLSPAVMCITGLDDGRIREVNDAFLQLIGFDRADVMGRHIVDLNLWIDPGQREQGIALLRAGSSARDFTARLRVKGGEERVCVLAAELVTLSGEPCILTTLTDITDRTRAEEALRESERRFMLIFPRQSPADDRSRAFRTAASSRRTTRPCVTAATRARSCSAGRSPSSISGLRPSRANGSRS